jgi:hypothetical protein
MSYEKKALLRLIKAISPPRRSLADANKNSSCPRGLGSALHHVGIAPTRIDKLCASV